MKFLLKFLLLLSFVWLASCQQESDEVVTVQTDNVELRSCDATTMFVTGLSFSPGATSAECCLTISVDLRDGEEVCIHFANSVAGGTCPITGNCLNYQCDRVVDGQVTICALTDWFSEDFTIRHLAGDDFLCFDVPGMTNASGCQ